MCFFPSFFFFKQKTAYEMRISDWSSDVCSSDLHADALALLHALQIAAGAERLAGAGQDDGADAAILAQRAQRVDDVVAIRVGADRVHALGLVHRQDRDLAAPFDTQKFTHASISLRRPNERRHRRAMRSEEHTSELQSPIRNSTA